MTKAEKKYSWKELILIFMWTVGNMVIMSSVIYLKYKISGICFDTYLLSIFMIAWVLGQLRLFELTKK